MTLTLRITPGAEADLIGIWLYTSEAWGAEQADRYLEQLESGMTHLLKHPSIGTDYGHIRNGYRRFRIEHHDVFYRIHELEIIVVRVLHEDMDAPRRLLD